MARLIFCDFDGVLNTDPLAHNFSLVPAKVRLLNQLVEETDAAVVISSMWRFLGLQECRRRLKAAGFVGHVVGRTPDMQHRPRYGNMWRPRGDEIQAYLDSNRVKVDSFAILDDHNHMAHLLPRLAQTDGRVGLTVEDCLRVQLLLEISVEDLPCPLPTSSDGFFTPHSTTWSSSSWSGASSYRPSSSPYQARASGC